MRTLPASTGRVLIVGDVHGCADELSELLRQFAPRAEDILVTTGDTINRGPQSRRVLQLVREHRIHTVLGNHELRFLRARLSGNTAMLKNRDRDTYEQLQAADFAQMVRWPHVIRIPQFNTLVVHGGFLPQLPWQHQMPSVVTEIQVIDTLGRGGRRGDFADALLWGQLWKGPERVIFGHTPLPEIQRHPYALGLDTGCVYGFHLSAISLPDEKIYAVCAKFPYSKI